MRGLTATVLMVAAAPVIGGCAGQQYGQAMHQLRSDVNLLDQRVSQLERANLGQASQPTAAWPAAETPAQPQGAAGPAPAQPAASAPVPAPMLKPTKREIQQALKNAGFYQGAVDGRVGQQTRDAVKEFQKANGLKVDGVVGRQTWERLAPHLDQSAGAGHEPSAAETLK